MYKFFITVSIYAKTHTIEETFGFIDGMKKI
jgi:hypothetical protein